VTLKRRSRHIPDLFDQIGMGTMTVWLENKNTKVKSQKSTHSAPVTHYYSYAGSSRGYQITDSENHSVSGPRHSDTSDRDFDSILSELKHPLWLSKDDMGSASYDVGGEFFSQKVTIDATNMSDQSITGRLFSSSTYDWVAEYHGPILSTPVYLLPIPVPVLGNLNSIGTTAIARCSPTNNVASAANFLRELHQEGLPELFGLSLLKERSSFFKNLGEEYLNKEFGWDPFIGDIKAIAFAATHAHKVLSQYERDSGKMVRRRYEFPEVTTQSTTSVRAQNALIGDWGGLFSGAPTFYPSDPTEIFRSGGSSGSLYKTSKSWKKTWFSGAFTYHLPSGYKSRLGLAESARHAQFLLGLDITPEVLWNAAPWTWAIDWFTNAGDVVANLSDWSTDGLVLKYGYVMEHSIVSDTYFVTNRGGLSSKTAQPSEIVISVETKRRVKATPFGFGLTWSGLSPRQIAITVALGLTKGLRLTHL